MQNVDILLVDANQLFREGLKRLLEGSGFVIAAEAESVEGGLQHLRNGLKPKVALVDFDGSHDDYTALQHLRETDGQMKLVILATGEQDIVSLARCFEAGADAYLLKTISSEALRQSVVLVLMGEKVFPTKLAAMLVRDAGPAPVASTAEIGRLSQRESQILRCLLSGQPNKVIAKQLNITEATVKVHLKGVMKKISAANRTQAAIWALNNGLASDLVPPS